MLNTINFKNKDHFNIKIDVASLVCLLNQDINLSNAFLLNLLTKNGICSIFIEANQGNDTLDRK